MRKEFSFVLSLGGASTDVVEGHDPLVFWKEIAYEGTWKKGKQEVVITPELMDHWATTFDAMNKEGIQVPVPIEHTKDPEKRRGTVTALARRINSRGRQSLFGKFKFRDEEAAKLAKTAGASIFVPATAPSGSGRVFKKPIEHVAITDYPVIADLEPFQAVALSFNEEDHPRHEAGDEKGGEFAPKGSKGSKGKNAGDETDEDREEKEVTALLAEREKQLNRWESHLPKGARATAKRRMEAIEQQISDMGHGDKIPRDAHVVNPYRKLDLKGKGKVLAEWNEDRPSPDKIKPSKAKDAKSLLGKKVVIAEGPHKGTKGVFTKVGTAGDDMAWYVIKTPDGEEHAVSNGEWDDDKPTKLSRVNTPRNSSGYSPVRSRPMPKTKTTNEDEDVTLKDLAVQCGLDPNLPDEQVIMALSKKFTELKGPSQTGAQPVAPPRPAYPMHPGMMPQPGAPRPFGMSYNEDTGEDEPVALSGSMLNIVKKARRQELERLTEHGIITPATRDEMVKEYLKDEVIQFSHCPGFDDGFDRVVALLEKNGRVVPKGKTGPQTGVVALSKSGTDGAEKDYLDLDVERRRKEHAARSN
jgi:hypothetical protein